ncbi:ribulose-phosphate 3-epimerase [Helicobacter sp. MIT 21-1697]|uniref:ribulose-phosphate 3-epimerase n=1 Tax=Helicobacter sp. MIT 21-1697 TaxID=2993733 RepID=UPI00224AB724|nr:ribulose-phosphate 3-epimerase [Helicobacter sp. MIT 21-1697]MCX2717871.1 ribulose-phosphate 3-epimerase [Helicobacter sp. MIT 21-1697]
MSKDILVAPSMLSADFATLGQEVEDICKAGCDFVHIDVMDGHFVPNLTMGPMIVQSIAKRASKPLDIHLMVKNVPFFVDLFLPLKPAFMSVHIEEVQHLHRLIWHIKESGVKAGVVLNPHTSEQNLEYILPDIDLILLMSVNPGFGGQSFIPHSIKKLQNLKKMRDRLNPSCLLEIDGGVSDKNIADLKAAGIDMVVAGSFIFNSTDYAKAIAALK